MTVKSTDGSPEDFLRQLREFYFECGEPSYRMMERTSRKLAELYPSVFEGREPILLTRNVLWWWLSGKRKGLPDHGLLVSFLLVCQWLGFRSHALDEDKGADILEEWHQRLKRARAWTDGTAEHDEGEADPAAGEEGPRQGPLSRTPPLPAPPAVPALPAQIVVAARPIETQPAPQPPGSDDGPPGHERRPEDDCLTSVAWDDWEPLIVSPLQRAHLESYGSYGRFLAEQVAVGSAEAAYHAGVLLGGAPDSAEAAMPFLLYAAAAGHVQALDLLLASSGRIDHLDAAAHAYELAEAAAGQSQTAVALLWYECAARNGLPAAAMKLALYYQARGEGELAIRWLGVAAEYGDTRAEITLAELTRRDRFPGRHNAMGGARTPYN